MLSSFAAGNHQPSDSGSQKSIVRNDSPGPLKMTVTKLQYSLVKNLLLLAQLARIQGRSQSDA
jgi:hypothetical protein